MAIGFSHYEIDRFCLFYDLKVTKLIINTHISPRNLFSHVMSEVRRNNCREILIGILHLERNNFNWHLNLTNLDILLGRMSPRGRNRR